MTSPEVLTVQVVGERSDTTASRSAIPICGDNAALPWCEVDMIQDAICGNCIDGLALMESRDDDNASNNNGITSEGSDRGEEDSAIDERLKTFSQQLQLTKSIDNKGSSSVGGLDGSNRSDSNPAIISKQDSTKGSAMSSHQLRCKQFMVEVESASRTHGMQSIPVADLYLNMGSELSIPRNTSAIDSDKSKEFALLLLEEAFTIYQAKLGDNDVQTIDARIRLGLAYRSLTRYEEALDCFCLAVYMREALNGELHPSVSEVWVLISAIHHERKKLELALKASAKALTGYRNAHGDKHFTVINVLKTIAQIHIEMGNNDKAADIKKYVSLHSNKDDSSKHEI